MQSMDGKYLRSMYVRTIQDARKRGGITNLCCRSADALQAKKARTARKTTLIELYPRPLRRPDRGALPLLQPALRRPGGVQGLFRAGGRPTARGLPVGVCFAGGSRRSMWLGVMRVELLVATATAPAPSSGVSSSPCGVRRVLRGESAPPHPPVTTPAPAGARVGKPSSSAPPAPRIRVRDRVLHVRLALLLEVVRVLAEFLFPDTKYQGGQSH